MNWNFRKYDNMLTGEFLLYKHTELEVEVSYCFGKDNISIQYVFESGMFYVKDNMNVALLTHLSWYLLVDEKAKDIT